MPDVNKFQALASAGYKIPVTCGICKFKNIAEGKSWGTCKEIKYAHLKHTGEEREASIHRLGSCSKAVLDEAEDAKLGLGAHEVFLQARNEEKP